MGRPIIWNDDLDNALRAVYADPTLDRRGRERKMGISHVTLYRRALFLGITPVNRARVRAEARRKKAREMAKNGIPSTRISEYLGLCRDYVAVMQSRFGDITT